MKIYVVNEFWEEVSAGSDPSSRTLLFSSPEKRDAFILDWNNDNSHLEKAADEPNKYYGGQGWIYWLETNEMQIDVVKSKYSDRIEKKY